MKRALALLLGACAIPPALANLAPVPVADARAGRIAFLRCAACHALNSDAPHKTGPNLNAILDKPAGRVSGFTYSDALRRAAPTLTWDRPTLKRWIENPSAVLPGTSMVYANTLSAVQVEALIDLLSAPSQASP